MGAVMVVVFPPGPDQSPGMAQVGEQVLVEALVPQAAIEAFHEAVLHRLSRRDVVPLDVALLLPLQDRVRGELGAIVDLPRKSGEHQLRNQEVFYGKRKQADAGISA